MTSAVEALCETAMLEGRGIDLTGCSFGRRFTTGEFRETPVSYYFLLAGLVRSLDLRRVLEIGTHWGGAIMSMSRGLRDPDSGETQLVTVDVTDRNTEGFRAYPRITRITGDSFDRHVVDAVASSFRGPVDLVFIDTIHTYRPTHHNIAIYANRFAPRLVVLDDIHINSSMDRLWSDVARAAGDRAFDATTLCDREVGFGVVLWDPALRWPERYGKLVTYWKARRWLSERVPHPVGAWRRRLR
jgi:predicted O-methyltransferase YrrM